LAEQTNRTFATLKGLTCTFASPSNCEKKLFFLPCGFKFAPRSYGCNSLARQGAILEATGAAAPGIAQNRGSVQTGSRADREEFLGEFLGEFLEEFLEE
jgi:hypothetical protein